MLHHVRAGFSCMGYGKMLKLVEALEVEKLAIMIAPARLQKENPEPEPLTVIPTHRPLSSSFFVDYLLGF